MKRALKRSYIDGKPAPEPSEHLTDAFLAAWNSHDTTQFHSRKAHYAEVFAWGQAAERAELRKAIISRGGVPPEWLAPPKD